MKNVVGNMAIQAAFEPSRATVAVEDATAVEGNDGGVNVQITVTSTP